MKKRFLFLAITASLIICAGCGDDSSTSGGSGEPENPQTSAVCGNKVVESDETCDDGNTADGDGCSAVCRTEADYTCPGEGGACTKNEENPEPGKDAVCGNGAIEDGELCDDGNEVSDDGCSSSCQLEEGYRCPTPGAACEAIPVCGNSKIDAELNETCDDGNAVAGDGCSADCQIEEGYLCPIVGEPCASMQCGDGEVQTENGEECDNMTDYNVEYGSYEGQCGLNCHFAHYCGDGLLDEVDKKYGEECDAKGDTSEAYNGCNASCKRVNYCGDGTVSHDEVCDDGNDVSGDGCSSNCEYEQGFACSISNGKTTCLPIPCGNGKLDANETCDDGNRTAGDGCSAACLVEAGYHCNADSSGVSVCVSTIGNGVLDADAGEECDDGNIIDGDGCSSKGAVEPGWICPTAGEPCKARACGDGILAKGEACDDGNTEDGDGCSYRCKVEDGYLCETPGKPCVAGSCGDGIVQQGEACDDGNAVSGDGCSAKCAIEPYYECKSDGGACQKVTCGDGSIVPTSGYTSYETCDLGSGLNDGSAGCSAECAIISGYHCDENGQNCVAGSCGDGILDVGEECDDGNTNPTDGCSPSCKRETGIECVDGSCRPVCGDGITMWMLDASIAEECDDGNLVSGDGCSAECKVESGFTCTDFKAADLPDVISLPVTYRDFKGRDEKGTADGTNGLGTKAFVDAVIAADSECARVNDAGTSCHAGFYANYGHPDFNSNQGLGLASYSGGSGWYEGFKAGLVEQQLSSDGKPVYKSYGASNCVGGYNKRQLTCKASFDMWYRDTPMYNKTYHHKLNLWLSDKATAKYYFTSDNPTNGGKVTNTSVDGKTSLKAGMFSPLTSAGYGNTPSYSYNYGFTTEIETYFQYKGGETLNFTGDDDVWVFINNRLFVDLGGMHGGVGKATNKLAATPFATKDASGNDITISHDPDFDVYEGGIYPIHLFQAERSPSGSNFSLTLAGFVNTGTASCDSVCGDGVVRGAEECDYVNINTDTDLQFEKGCSASCKLDPHCGNHKIESGEQCDEGTSGNEWCTASCKLSADSCGNGTLDEHEQCDYAITDPSNKDYHAGCLKTCRISGCGDGILDTDAGEECDDGNTSDEDMCSSVCKLAVCGDGITQAFLGEVCDDGINDGAYGHCGLNCSYQPPFCGDGVVASAYEVCDDGVNDGAYGGCMPGCQQRAAHCGDGIVQTDQGEACDPADTSSSVACSPSCEIMIL